MKTTSFKDLIVWQKSYELVLEVGSMLYRMLHPVH